MKSYKFKQSDCVAYNFMSGTVIEIDNNNPLPVVVQFNDEAETVYRFTSSGLSPSLFGELVLISRSSNSKIKELEVRMTLLEEEFKAFKQ